MPDQREHQSEQRRVELTFPKDIASHQLTILRDDGLYRHIRARRPDTSCMGFDILTWPGYLAYAGDMGTYVFQRTPDMFEFFRPSRHAAPDRYSIDLHYWAEKVEAKDRAGVQKFCEHRFRTRLTEIASEWAEDLSEADRERLLSEMKDEVFSQLGDMGEVGGRIAADDFKFDGKTVFSDLFEVDFREFTTRFVWCCHALVWAIRAYDATKAPADPQPAAA